MSLEIADKIKQLAEQVALDQKKIAVIHLNQLLRRAAHEYPYDLVIRHLDDVVEKMATRDPQRLVSCREIEGLYNDFAGLDHDSAAKDVLANWMPSLKKLAESQIPTPVAEHETFDQGGRPQTPNLKNQIVERGRELIAQRLSQCAEVEHPQIAFEEFITTKSDESGNPEVGILRYTASFATGQGLKKIAVPVILDKTYFRAPSVFYGAEKQYPLNNQGLREFKAANAKDVQLAPEHILMEDVLRAPVQQTDVQIALEQRAAQLVSEELDKRGFRNAQIKRYASKNDEITMQATISTPYGIQSILVPVEVHQGMVLYPTKFTATAYRTQQSKTAATTIDRLMGALTGEQPADEEMPLEPTLDELSNTTMVAGKTHTFDKVGFAEYLQDLNSGTATQVDLHPELIAESYNELRKDLFEAVTSGNIVQAKQNLQTIRLKFGQAQFAKVQAELNELVADLSANKAQACGSCPFYEQPGKRFASAHCNKFSQPLTKVAVSQRGHELCSLKRVEWDTNLDDQYKGSINTSSIVLN